MSDGERRRLIVFSQVKEEAISAAEAARSLWHHRIPLGRITLVVGRPGEGKSFMTTDWAAKVSAGSPWPDGAPCARGSVLIVSAEDDAGVTIRPRLDARRGDPSKIHILSGVRRRETDGTRTELAFALADVAVLEESIKQIPDLRLIVIDPIGSYLGGRVDAHRDNETRAVLSPVARLGERYGAAIIMVAHRRKSGGEHADDTALGSRAFTGIARVVWHVSRHPDDKTTRLFLPGRTISRQKVTACRFRSAEILPAYCGVDA